MSKHTPGIYDGHNACEAEARSLAVQTQTLTQERDNLQWEIAGVYDRLQSAHEERDELREALRCFHVLAGQMTQDAKGYKRRFVLAENKHRKALEGGGG